MEGRITKAAANNQGTVETGSDKYGSLTIYKLPSNIPVGQTVEFEIRTSKYGNDYAVFVSSVERNNTIYNTEDRSKWYTWGEDEEADFVKLIVPHLGIDLRKNPEKATCPWEIDLIDYTNNRPADLKTQNTPYFTCGKYRYGNRPYDPRYTVSFNKKDYEKYRIEYPDCDVYFWVNWTQLENYGVRIEGLQGVWRAPFPKMIKKIESNEVALHAYLHRKNDDHNAKDSYLFDLTDTEIFEQLL